MSSIATCVRLQRDAQGHNTANILTDPEGSLFKETIFTNLEVGQSGFSQSDVLQENRPMFCWHKRWVHYMDLKNEIHNKICHFYRKIV